MPLTNTTQTCGERKAMAYNVRAALAAGPLVRDKRSGPSNGRQMAHTPRGGLSELPRLEAPRAPRGSAATSASAAIEPTG